MNARDFCFWIQGYIELTGEEYPQSISWGLILEHLELAKLQKGVSEEEFEGVVEMLLGFVSVAGNTTPTETQWKRIVDVVANTFIKVTSALDEVDPDNEPEDILKIIKDEIEKNRQKNPVIPPPYMPSPWREDSPLIPDPWKMPPTIICSSEPSMDNISESLNQVCETIESLHNNKPSDTTFCEDMYSSQMSTMDMYELGANLGKND